MGLPVEVNNLMMGAVGGYQVSRSLRFRSSATAYLQRTMTTPTNQYIWTWSAWVKRGIIGTSQTLFEAWGANNDTQYGAISFYTDQLSFGGWFTSWRKSTQVFRDPSAWYHIIVAVDTTQATGANRVKLYVNGVQITAFSTSNDPPQNSATGINTAVYHRLGQEQTAQYFDGYMAEVNFIDGQALTPSSFGETDAITGVWNPKKYSGTYGTNGFYLNFSDNSAATATTIGKDYSGNGNNWTPNNISVTAGTTYDSMIDSPTPYADGGNGRGNYAVVNPLYKGSSLTVSNANLTLAGAGATYNIGESTVSLKNGQYYCEFTLTTGDGSTYVGICTASQALGASASAYLGVTGSQSYGYYEGGQKRFNNTSTAYGASYTSGDIIGIAYDGVNGTLTFYKNGSSQGTAFTGIDTTVDWFFAVSLYAGVGSFNFGQRPFSYTPPSGFKALNTYNLPAASISNGAKHFAATKYTGNGTSQSIVNSGPFQPDLVWIKRRNTAADHVLYDSVRTLGVALSSNLTSAEPSVTNGLLTAFNSNGFSVAVVSSNNSTNGNSDTYVGWQWKGGGTAVTNNSGTITSQVSANTSAGISILTYTGNGTAGATVGHGLGVAPNMIIVKNRGNAPTSWAVYHSGYASASYYQFLDTTSAAAANNVVWNGTAPTSSVFSIGTDVVVNSNTNTYVAYCFSAVSGFSAFGKYTGNGSADGPFVYTGFRPRFLLVKDSSAAQNWRLFDSSRSTYNAVLEGLFPNLSNAESTAETGPDFLSNGFKIRTSSNTHNASGNTIIYMAFAENPFNLSRAR